MSKIWMAMSIVLFSVSMSVKARAEPVCNNDIECFIKSAISESSWNESLYSNFGYSSYKGVGDDSYRQDVKKYLPELSEYIFRENGIPPSLVINKWPTNNVINIGINWPKFIQPYTVPSKELSSVNYKIAEEAIKENILLIQKASGLSLVFLREENYSSYAKFRIIFINSEQFIKKSSKLSRGFQNFTQTPYFHRIFEPSFISAVPFSPYSDLGVDGYILPSVSNEIEWAVCYLNVQTPAQELFFKIQECLLRGLGLPDEIEKNKAFGFSEKQEKIISGIHIKFLEFMYKTNVFSGDSYWQVYDKLEKIK